MPLRNHRGRQEGEIEHVATVQRQFVGFALIDDLAERRGVRLQQRSLAGNFDAVGSGADLHDQIDGRGLLNLNDYVRLRGALETRLFGVDAVVTGKQVRKQIKSVGRGSLNQLCAAVQVCQCEVHVGK